MYPETEAKYLSDAKRDYPDGIKCGFCGADNDFADDCGWFYCVPLNYLELREKFPMNLMKPCCKKCWDGQIGTNHISIFGLGER